MTPSRPDRTTVTITRHARARLQERFVCSPEKALKIAKKAFTSVDPLSNAMARKVYRKEQKGWYAHEVYRNFCGILFIFDCSAAGSAVCVTVINLRIQ